MSVIKTNDSYIVTSVSNPNEPHFLYKKESEWVCDCKGFMYRRICHHVKEVMEMDKGA